MALPNEEDNRVMTYLAKIAGRSVDLTPPRTRLEIFFAMWAGMDYPLPPAPYTRFERFLLAAMGRGNLPSGCYTRLELFFNNIAGGVARLPDTDNSLLERYLREIAGGGLEIVYEGNLPTTIPGAIHELIRYGKCVQDGTPTPTNPVDIVCNNGVIKVNRFDLNNNTTGPAFINDTPEVLTVGDQTATVPDLYAVGDYKDEVDLVSGTVTRRVGVQLLTGEEDWRQLSGVKAYFTEISDMKVCNPVEAGFSTHFIGTAAATSSMPDGSIKLTYTSAPRGAISIRYNAAASTDDLKAYLAAQYAAGTPVIVLYPLATETTEEITPQPITSSGAVSSTTNAPPAEVKITYRG